MLNIEAKKKLVKIIHDIVDLSSMLLLEEGQTDEVNDATGTDEKVGNRTVRE